MPTTPPRNGITIDYDVHGAGPESLILISGTGHDRAFWSGQIPRFAEQYQVIVFDNRGVGTSTVPEPGYSLRDMADDTLAVLDAVGVERCHVMGFSMGGHIAQETAIAAAHRIQSLGIHHSWARNSPRLRSFQETRLALAAADQRLALTEFSLLGLHSSGWYNEHEEEINEHRTFLQSHSPVNAGWIGQLQACLRGDTFARLPSITAPTLVTASDLDLIAPPHLSEEIAAAIPHSELVILEDCGHVALIERPAEFAEICLEFVDRHASGG